ncbi:bifunctional folylpolyglutamate synthase/dihydrofolate synthase [Myroides guanonis]|uniref:Dihydrofolate synthase/folylpolyglutamate synthase n=1 Tax=Myroides guanonis TaxID=1150112 RepID=A0A1I3UV48_9FLAO|nr:folylpolyglutamate synthase/dihydrofolate synthase family protein [Myroides guanonis]SFJ86579.1 dihydrofolate synthase / folylpolyglutamate synthase [Myroides guanonis]
MTYQETLDWMFVQLPMYQNLGSVAYKADLSNALLLADHLGNPERKLKTIHIAGTNGKGSTSSLIASVLQEAGYKVGLYTSPHLKDFRERIKINGEVISEDYVCSFIAENKEFFENHQLSFFEMTVGMALEYFNKEEVDVAVIEVGMGGRLDATNIITPLLSVITNIGKDHTAFLGTSLAEIAGEKAGIIKSGVPVIIGEYTTETREVFVGKASREQAPIYFASDTFSDQDLISDLKGDYQEKNIRTARQAIALLREHFSITEQQEEEGLLHVVQNTGLAGRWQILQQTPKVIADTAHNPHGLSIVMAQLARERYKKLYMVLGFVKDKDLDEILPLLPKDAKYLFAKPEVARGLDADELRDAAALYGLEGDACGSVTEAYAKALQEASALDVIYVGGSTFVVSEIL